MRVTGGILKGWVIPTKFASHVRPSTDRMRESLFNSLVHQFGIEALGFAGPDIDAEIILMGQRLWDELGLKGVRLEINSLGQTEERLQQRTAHYMPPTLLQSQLAILESPEADEAALTLDVMTLSEQQCQQVISHLQTLSPHAVAHH